MSTFLILNGLAAGIIIGVIYSLIGISLNVLYGVLRVINFAHGEFIMAGAFLSFVLFSKLGIDPLFALPIAFCAFFVAGFILYFLLLPRLRHADDPDAASLLLTYGLSLMLGAALLLIFGADPRSLNFNFAPLFVKLGVIFLPTARLVALALDLGLVAALVFFLYFTLPGKALRAAIMNREAIQIVGVNIERLSSLTFALAIGLAGATGVLVALVFPTFGPFDGGAYTLIGFVVIVIGGLGNPVGALLGGIIYGLAEQIATVFLSPSLASAIGFSALIVVVLIRPAGLFGRIQAK